MKRNELFTMTTESGEDVSVTHPPPGSGDDIPLIIFEKADDPDEGSSARADMTATEATELAVTLIQATPGGLVVNVPPGTISALGLTALSPAERVGLGVALIRSAKETR